MIIIFLPGDFSNGRIFQIVNDRRFKTEESADLKHNGRIYGMLLLKFIGLIDFLSAIIIVFNIYSLPWLIVFIHVFIMLGKVTTSLFADPIGKVFGLIDIITGVFILFAVTGFAEIKLVMAAILIYKAAVSMY